MHIHCLIDLPLLFMLQFNLPIVEITLSYRHFLFHIKLHYLHIVEITLSYRQRLTVWI